MDVDQSGGNGNGRSGNADNNVSSDSNNEQNNQGAVENRSRTVNDYDTEDELLRALLGLDLGPCIAVTSPLREDADSGERDGPAASPMPSPAGEHDTVGGGGNVNNGGSHNDSNNNVKNVATNGSENNHSKTTTSTGSKNASSSSSSDSRINPNWDWALNNYDVDNTEPQTISQELHRLQVLKSYLVLDTEREIEFERLTKIASRTFNVPICLISLVDLGRQWFLSNRGLGDVRETPRKLAFCAHVIVNKNDIFVIPDASKDQRFQNSDLVVGPPHIRFYAGAPLISPEGCKLGTFCIIDSKPRPEGLSSEESQNLMDMAAMTVKLMADRRAMSTLEDPARMIACTAHDLLTPLSGVQLSLSLLKDDHDVQTQLSDHNRDLLLTAARSADIMLRICQGAIETLRETNISSPVKTSDMYMNNDHNNPKPSDGSIVRRPSTNSNPARSMSGQSSNSPCVDLIELTKSLHLIMDPIPKRVPCVISIDKLAPRKILTDDLKIFRSSLNLLSNAIAVTEFGSIHFRIYRGTGDGKSNGGDDKNDNNPNRNHLVFQCEDTGRDIHTDDYDLLFSPCKDGKEHISDLGLYSVASQIGALGGKYGFRPRSIGADRKTPQFDSKGRRKTGSIFWFSIPIVLPRDGEEQEDDDKGGNTTAATTNLKSTESSSNVQDSKMETESSAATKTQMKPLFSLFASGGSAAAATAAVVAAAKKREKDGDEVIKDATAAVGKQQNHNDLDDDIGVSEAEKRDSAALHVSRSHSSLTGCHGFANMSPKRISRNNSSVMAVAAAAADALARDASFLRTKRNASFSVTDCESGCKNFVFEQQRRKQLNSLDNRTNNSIHNNSINNGEGSTKMKAKMNSLFQSIMDKTMALPSGGRDNKDTTSFRALTPPPPPPPPPPVAAPTASPIAPRSTTISTTTSTSPVASGNPCGSTRKRKALVIEDSVVVSKCLARALTKLGYDVVIQAVNGEIGCREMQQHMFDLVLCDFLMPVMDGLDCVQQYRKWEVQNRPSFRQYIIGISAHASKNDVEKGLKIGMDDYRPKPITMKILKSLINGPEIEQISSILDDIHNAQNNSRSRRTDDATMKDASEPTGESAVASSTKNTELVTQSKNKDQVDSINIKKGENNDLQITSSLSNASDGNVSPGRASNADRSNSKMDVEKGDNATADGCNCSNSSKSRSDICTAEELANDAKRETKRPKLFEIGSVEKAGGTVPTATAAAAAMNHCLIVTDQTPKEIHLVVKRIEEIGGWKTKVVYDGQNALKLLQLRNWDAVLIDDDLGPKSDMSGIQCISQFREWESKNRVNRQNNMFLVLCTGIDTGINDIPLSSEGHKSTSNHNNLKSAATAVTTASTTTVAVQVPSGFDGVLTSPISLDHFRVLVSKSNVQSNAAATSELHDNNPGLAIVTR